MMKLGFVSAILPELSLEQVLQFAAEEGFACVEAMCWPTGRAERKYAGVTHVDVQEFSAAKTKEVQSLCSRYGVCFSALGYYPNVLDPDPEVSRKGIAHLEKVIRAAATLGIPKVNSFVGRDWTRSVDDNWPRFLEVWKPLVALAESEGVWIAIENCPMFFTSDEWPGGKNLMTSPLIWRRAFADIGSERFGLNYDPSHFVLQMMDPTWPLAEFRHKLFHVHAKDVYIDRRRLNDVGVFATPLQWHQPRIPGYGEIDWGRFFARLMQVGYDGPVCIEVEDDTFPRTLEGRKAALKVARNVLKPYFA